MKLKNLAAVLVKQHDKLSIYGLENLSFIPAGYVLVKIKYSGICHTQLNEIRGVLGKDKFLPHCIGHEGVGEVIKVGSGVKNIKIGETVVISWIRNKLKKKKYNHVCYEYKGKKINTGGCNTLLNYSLVSDDRVFKINNKNKFIRESILLGCALPTASNAILNIANINSNSNVLIMGMGGLGYSSLFVLNFIKCKRITCIDSNPRRINLIKNLKNCSFLHMDKKKLKKFVIKNYESFDLIIDCTGSNNLIEKTFSLCKKFGGQFIIIGNTKINEKILIKTWDIIFGKTLTGAWGQGGAIMNNFEINQNILIDQIKNIRKILPKKNFKINQINKAIKDFDAGKILRPIIKF